ncbi:sensor histidine kinase [Dactylosporangium matsuzakiense]|uniref:histidine kinase n=1 Tax=Dactylosporangium matsuzakiense TaxID=53360 RepID=A0A9W6NJJ8_9ACTN|nr:sensor histidine kinase [Dactylosporangium matsuzakiense]UWZ45263.1 sensor histidine kinase [Dactylosporangium matsuzakiense]GLK98766.1 two-component sensor histidine kinase [Dactylosporangium matsuzakiense]
MSLLRRLRPTASGVALGRVVGALLFVAAAVLVVPADLRWLALACAAVAVTGAVFSWRARADQPIRRVIALVVMAAGGHALYIVDPASPGWLPAGIAISVALAALPLVLAVPFVLVTIATAALIAELRNPAALVPMMAGCVGFAVLGVVVGSSRQRADQAERLLASEKATQEAEARAQVYAERARLAREIHDILAHTLSAQIVGLESARLLLRRNAPAEAVLQQIDQAQKLAREGLDETRQAVHSLRGDTRPTADTVRELAASANARLTVEGPVEPLSPEAGLAVERTVREALTNVRKHAPGAAVRVRLSYAPSQVEVEVCDNGSASRSELDFTGAGYGLAGLRERAELLGGKLDAGPVDEGFRVWLTIPR